jgi:hypothetical protein
MEFENTKWYKIIYTIINVIEKLLFFCMGILIPIQIGWVNREKSYSMIFTEREINQMSQLFSFSPEKIIYYFDNILITFSALFIIGIYKFTAWLELKYANIKIIKKMAICAALFYITINLINES